MSLIFASGAHAGAKPEKATIQKMLDENGQLIRVIVRYQNMGRANDALQYQQLLHRNLIYLSSLADASVQRQLMQQAETTEASKQESNQTRVNNSES